MFFLAGLTELIFEVLVLIQDSVIALGRMTKHVLESQNTLVLLKTPMSLQH